jgi:protoporphyrinogen/coproporphyrinogen III oxidase
VADALIIGGGIAGLSAAFELRQRGIPFLLLERASVPGGVIQTERIDGFTIDAGPDSLLIQKPDGVRLCQELGLGDRLVSTLPPRVAFVQRNGTLHPLPAASVLGIPTRPGPFIRTHLFSWPGKLRMAAELFVPRRVDAAHGMDQADQSDESIGAFITRRFGREATIYLAEPLLAGIHAGDVDRLSLEALFPRFAEAERSHGSLIRAFRRTLGAPSADGAFKSLPGGLTELVRALVAALPPQTVQTNAQVTRLSRTAAGTFRVELAGGITHEARAAIVATPAYVTSELVRDLDADIAERSAAIRYSSIATVALAFRRTDIGHPLNGSGYVVPRTEANGILAVTWLSSKWPNRAPAETALLRTFVGGSRDPEAITRTDAELIGRSLDAMRPVLALRGEPLFTRVYRFERASAQHEVGHRARMREIDRRLAAQPGLFLTGSGFRGVGIPDCIADARAQAARAGEWMQHAAAEATAVTRRAR